MMEPQTPSGVWALRQGPEHNHIDGRTHVHHIHLFNQVTGGEHNIDLLLHVPACRECGRAFPGSIFPVDAALTAEIQKQIGILEENHVNIMAYAAAAGLPIKLGQLASVKPPAHLVSLVGDMKMLHLPRTR